MKRSNQRKIQRMVKTPGNRSKIQFRKKRPAYHTCGSCGKKMTRARLCVSKFRKLSKTQRRPERPYPELCSKCMRLKIKERLR